MRIKQRITFAVLTCVACSLLVAGGCGGNGPDPDALPTDPQERIKAIEQSTTLSAEQKSKARAQLEETIRAREMAKQMAPKK